MSVLDQIAELEAKKQSLMASAKKEALAKAQKAVDDLNALGFNYRLSGGATGGTRRTGIRAEVLATIKKSPNGISRKDLLSALGADDKSGKQSVSNAISALKKAGAVSGDNGIYKAN